MGKSRKRRRRLRDNDMVDAGDGAPREDPVALRLSGRRGEDSHVARQTRCHRPSPPQARASIRSKASSAGGRTASARRSTCCGRRWAYAYAGRKLKKRDFRRLWITRINAACRENGTTYSQLMDSLEEERHRARSQGARRHGRERRRHFQAAHRARRRRGQVAPRTPRDLGSHGVRRRRRDRAGLGALGERFRAAVRRRPDASKSSRNAKADVLGKNGELTKLCSS